MKLAFGSDHAGFLMKDALAHSAGTWGHEILDVGAANASDSVDYPDFAAAVGRAVVGKQADLGVLVCGTGLGVSIAANKLHGVRAALCGDVFSAKMARRHNDANVLCLGSRVVGIGLAEEILRAFLEASFEGARHVGRIAKITALDDARK
ncbi:MAG: ribose 5-phosphate isomerase B [Deltaproteobacteria bacterium]|nr:ribose 5-phosphate isomerase B [Deltaproteobacteria bacterium]